MKNNEIEQIKKYIEENYFWDEEENFKILNANQLLYFLEDLEKEVLKI